MDSILNVIHSNPFVAYFSLHASWLQLLEFFLRLVVACVCGAAIGFERSKRYKEAGLRTHVIVCMAAALFMIVSKYGFIDMANAADAFNNTRAADPARVAAQVVSGISFLGAGVIFKNNSNAVKGLTTAAGIWATAAIGLAIGGGMYYLGLFGTVLIAIVQVLMHKFKIGSDAASTYTRITLEVSDNRDFAKQLSDALSRWHAKPTETRITIGEDGTAKYDIMLRTSDNISPEDIMGMFADNDVVKNIAFVLSE